MRQPTHLVPERVFTSWIKQFIHLLSVSLHRITPSWRTCFLHCYFSSDGVVFPNVNPFCSVSWVVEHESDTVATASSQVQNFSVILGDIVHDGDSVWHMYLILHQILDLVLASSLSSGDVNLLKSLVTEHHQLYVQLFGKMNWSITSWYTVHTQSNYLDHWDGFGGCSSSPCYANSR